MAAGRRVIYGDTQIPIDDDVTPDDARAVLEEMFPEVRNATYHRDGQGNIVFTMQAGEKG